MTSQQLIKKLKRMAEGEGSQAALAKKLGISPSYLSDVLHGLRSPGASLLDPLGLEAFTEYRPRLPFDARKALCEIVGNREVARLRR
jgi:transcriptional regulator with XRE-family HTH domain